MRPAPTLSIPFQLSSQRCTNDHPSSLGLMSGNLIKEGPHFQQRTIADDSTGTSQGDEGCSPGKHRRQQSESTAHITSCHQGTRLLPQLASVF